MSRATVAACAVLALGGIALASGLGLFGHASCAALTDADKERLTSYVRQKYNLPPTAQIGTADAGPVSGSCFRKLVFATLDGREFHRELFASPDFRFLTTDLLDAKPDPKKAAEQRRQTAESLAVDTAPTRGGAHPVVTLAIFSDFQCPYCARIVTTLDDLAREQGDKLKILYHYFPLPMHRWARAAAEDAACAQRSGNPAFWSLHNFLFEHQKDMTPDNLRSRVAAWASGAAGLEPRAFETCVANEQTSGQVDQDVSLGDELGVNSTPTLFLDGEPIGNPSPENIKALVERAIRDRGASH